MSIPKLKVYRLDSDFNESNDTDIQTQTKDELLPIVGKELNPLSAAEGMVGVKLRGDCRVVSRGALSNVEAEIDPENSMRTVRVPCEGWIMGKANIDVSVLASDGTSWFQLDKRLWDCDVSEVKQYLVGGVYQDSSDASATGAHSISHISIRFGAMMENTGIAKNGNVPGYSQDWNDDGRTVLISYYPYTETDGVFMPFFGTGAASPAAASAPFSDAYNGNIDGRTIHCAYNDGQSTSVVAARSVPDGMHAVMTRMNRYEGNYLYRRRIFPLRVKPVELVDGACEVAASAGWYADGMMAPVFMERVPLESGGWVYKRLEEGTQFTKIYDVSGYTYSITMNKSYYRLPGGAYCYPDRIYVFYNFMDDDAGEPFDFDFNYSDTAALSESVPAGIQYDIYGGYGHGNSGSFVSAGQPFDGSVVLLRHEFLAVRNGYGYNAEFGDVLLQDGVGGTVGFTVPASFERNGIPGYAVDFSKGIQVYHNGVLVSGGSNPDYSVVVSGDAVSVSHPDGVVVNDLMVSCLVAPPSSGDDIVGWRVPCYEKVKKATLFVSSFPNWLKGHLNNDLDVFVGYQQYSGVNTVDEQIDSVYPKYVKDGWHPMYPEGALQFTEPVEEYDCYDIFNFGAAAGGPVAIPSDKAGETWTEVGSKLLPNYCPTNGVLGNYRLYWNRVMYNVAHYDALYQVVRGRMSNISVQGGVSRYRLLTDESASEAVGRRWTYRHDGNVRRMYSSGQDEIPMVLDSSENGRERPPAVSTGSTSAGTLVESDTATIVRADLSSERVMFIRYVLTGDPVVQNGFIVCLDPSSDEYAVTWPAGLTAGDVRVHVRINDGALEVGTEPAPQALVNDDTVFSRTVEWTPLPDRPDEIIPDIWEDVDIDAILDAGDDGNGNLYRYTYTGFPEFDVCFEPFSYHYTATARHEDRRIVSVEFMVYRTAKS